MAEESFSSEESLKEYITQKRNFILGHSIATNFPFTPPSLSWVGAVLDLLEVLNWQEQESKWIKLQTQMPTIEDNGEKVFVCRLVNPSQSSLNPSVMSVDKLHLCDPNETWWLPVPQLPNEVLNTPEK